MGRREVKQVEDVCDRCGVVISSRTVDAEGKSLSRDDSSVLESDIYPGVKVFNFSDQHEDMESIVEYPMLCKVCRRVIDRLIGEMQTVTRKRKRKYKKDEGENKDV